MSGANLTQNRTVNTILRQLRKYVSLYYALTSGDEYTVSAIATNYDQIIQALTNIASQKSTSAFLTGELTILELERIQLDTVLYQYGSEGLKISRELKTDKTSLQNGIDELTRALSALELRERDPALYHEISDASRPLGELDSHGVSKDVVRKCARSQAKRLQDQARGKSKSALDRKEQTVLAIRRENMEACEKTYLDQQCHYARERAES